MIVRQIELDESRRSQGIGGDHVERLQLCPIGHVLREFLGASGQRVRDIAGDVDGSVLPAGMDTAHVDSRQPFQCQPARR